MPDLDDIWRQIVEVHYEAKVLFLSAEELEPEQFQDFIQPVSEQRNALEHIVRAKANQFGLDQEPSSEAYHVDSLRCALAHEYRAFFDCADWIAIIVREDIQKTLSPYSQTTIQSAVPDYYPKIKPRLHEIAQNIAAIRAQKDISKASQIIERVREYKQVIEELLDIRGAIIVAVPSLEELRRKARWQNIRERAWAAFVGLLVGIVLMVLAGIGSCGKSPDRDSRTREPNTNRSVSRISPSPPKPWRDGLLLDLRSVMPRQDQGLVEAFIAAGGGKKG